ncbi:hypothetical protein [Paramicrobacterium fandaimingii]|uniref:hypothetical protein n=1 Tax=Paramicrobacterium fandaimingii TaxID=2708079 RepID=UPI001421BBA2|nr:hypothetical protein [Microbacterium fandaimingii]
MNASNAIASIEQFAVKLSRNYLRFSRAYFAGAVAVMILCLYAGFALAAPVFMWLAVISALSGVVMAPEIRERQGLNKKQRR